MDRNCEVIEVPGRKVGRIIGARGSKISEIQQTSQARIQISRDEIDGKKSIEIFGSDDQIASAKKLIEDCIQDRDGDFSSRSSGFRDGGSRGRRDEQNSQYGGESREAWGQQNSATSGNWRRRDDRDQWGRNSSTTDSWGRSDSQYESRRRTNDSDSWEEEGQRNDSWGGGRGGRFGGRRNDRGDTFQRDSRDNRNGSGGEREEIYVRTGEVGRVIGQGGSKIKNLQTESNCKIKVSRDGANGVNMVEIFGAQNDIETAKCLIGEVVDVVDCHGSCQGEEEGQKAEPEPTKRIPIDWSKVYQSSQEIQKNKFKELPPIIKDFYVEHEDVTSMSKSEAWLIRKENNNIMVENSDGDSSPFPNPIRTFEDAFHNYALILEQIYNQQFVKPSPIQSQAWPVLLQGIDLIGIAQTGTGKTLAFLLPALIHIDSQPVPRQERKGPSALILSPTRELAQQIEVEVNKINYKGIRSICVYGGGDRREQLNRCKKGVEIVVATPGRLNDFMNNGIIDVTNVTYLVMDEADRMLDLGFELEIKKVMMDIRPDRQTVMTSATWPPEVQHLADSYMTDPYKVFVGTLDLAAVHSVRQCIEICQDYEKKDILLEFIQEMQPSDKVIVFVGKKIVADDLSSDLAMSNIVCQCIHGDREQCDREAALSEFKSGYVRILVATDVASRGLDVPDITHVINFDFPRHIEEYVHRIGRTGRAGRSGTAITFVTRGDWKSAQKLIDIMAEADQEIPDDLVAMAERYNSFKQRRDTEGYEPGRGGRGRGRGGRGGRGGRRRDDEELFFM